MGFEAIKERFGANLISNFWLFESKASKMHFLFANQDFKDLKINPKNPKPRTDCQRRRA